MVVSGDPFSFSLGRHPSVAVGARKVEAVGHCIHFLTAVAAEDGDAAALLAKRCDFLDGIRARFFAKMERGEHFAVATENAVALRAARPLRASESPNCTAVFELQSEADGFGDCCAQRGFDSISEQLFAQAAAHGMRVDLHHREQHGALFGGEKVEHFGIEQRHRFERERSGFVEDDMADLLQFRPDFSFADEDTKPSELRSGEVARERQRDA